MFSIDELNGVMRMKGENRVVQFHKHHLDLCDLNEFDKKNLELFENYREYLNHFAQNGTAFTGLSDGEVFGMFGMWILWPGVAEGWLIPSRHIGRKTIPFHRGALRYFKYASAKLGVKRLQFTVHSQNVPACRWAERCYFEREGTLRNYGPDGADYFMFSRIMS